MERGATKRPSEGQDAKKEARRAARRQERQDRRRAQRSQVQEEKRSKRRELRADRKRRSLELHTQILFYRADIAASKAALAASAADHGDMDREINELSGKVAGKRANRDALLAEAGRIRTQLAECAAASAYYAARQ